MLRTRPENDIGSGLQPLLAPHMSLLRICNGGAAAPPNHPKIIDFQTIDDVPVRILFMIAAAYNQHAYYLQTLSFFSSKIKNKELREALLNVNDPMEAYKLLTE